MASELGLDPVPAKRAGLLHDIGKAVDHEIEGSHAVIGADLARRYGEEPMIVHAIEAHHNDVEPNSVIDVLVQAADAVSAARPVRERKISNPILSASRNWRKSPILTLALNVLMLFRPDVRFVLSFLLRRSMRRILRFWRMISHIKSKAKPSTPARLRLS